MPPPSLSFPLSGPWGGAGPACWTLVEVWAAGRGETCEPVAAVTLPCSVPRPQHAVACPSPCANSRCTQPAGSFRKGMQPWHRAQTHGVAYTACDTQYMLAMGRLELGVAGAAEVPGDACHTLPWVHSAVPVRTLCRYSLLLFVDEADAFLRKRATVSALGGSGGGPRALGPASLRRVPCFSSGLCARHACPCLWPLVSLACC